MDTAITHFILYVIGNLAVRTLSGILTPLTLYYLDPAQFGTLSLVTSAIAIITPIVGLGLRQLLALEYFHKTPQQQQALIHTIIIIYVNFCILSIPIAYLYWSMRPSGLDQTLFVSAIIITVFSFFVELIYQLLRYTQQAVSLIMVQLSTTLITGLTCLALLKYSSLSIASVLIGQVAGQLVTCAVGFPLCFELSSLRHAWRSFSLAIAVDHIRTGIIFIPNMLFAWILASSDRWFLAQYASRADIGIYAVADTGAQLFQTLILQAWAGSYLPMILSKYHKNTADILATERTNGIWMMGSMSIGIIAIAGGITYAGPLLALILPTAYHPAISYMWQLLAGQIALLGTYFASTLIQFQKKKLFLSCGLLIPAIINILLNYLLIPRYGLFGCTAATLSAYCIYFLITLCYNRHIQYQIRQHQLYQGSYREAHNSAHYIHSRTIPSSSKPVQPPDKMAPL